MKKVFTLFMTMIFAAFVMVSCGGGEKKKATSENQVKKEVKQEASDISTMTANLDNGKKIYNKYCIACHMTGVAGAAKLDNKERWTESANKGLKTLVDHALHGYQGTHGVLPEKGTCMECKTQDILDAVSFILNKAGVTAK